MKDEWFPLPHQNGYTWAHTLKTAGSSPTATVVPLVTQDEARTPKSYYTNPEHASFAEYASPNCCPNSYVDGFDTVIDIWLTKDFLETEKLHILRMAMMFQHISFLEDLNPIDPESGLAIEDLICLTHETTDKQTLVAWNGNDTIDYIGGNGHNLGSDVAGLTTDQSLEGVTFSPNNYYDALQYGKTAGKLRSVQNGLRWFNLSRNHPHRRIYVKQTSDTKRMQEYTHLGALFYVPQVDNHYQYHIGGDITTADNPHVAISIKHRFNEWNQNFNMELA